jgi:amino acid transporter
MTDHNELKRTLTLGPVVLYGVGTVLGAGIYVLMGEVACVAGIWAPLSFGIAAVLAALTGLTFAEFSNRFPVSAGEVVYVKQAFKYQRLSQAVALFVALTGIVSSATMINGFSGYFREFGSVPDVLLVPILCALLGALAAWGIAQSVAVASVITLAEVACLIAVIVVSLPDAMNGTGSVWPTTADALELFTNTVMWAGILSGVGIAFYAFIGFEDMVNVAEEVRDVRRVLPIEIMVGNDAPLGTVFAKSTGRAATEISVIALLAVIYGALIQVVMAARVLHGASRNNWLPPIFSRINLRTQTPVVATVLVAVGVLVFAL